MSPPLSHPKYRPDIDGLRAIAVLSVVLFHAFPSLLGGGFVGVDIFFVISGYLISIIIVGSLEKNNFSFSTFYARRIKRIFPALLLVLGSSLIFGWFSLTPDEYKQLGRHIVGGAEFISNFVLLKEDGYFDSAAETKPLLHLWSLGIEEQFYFFWPLFLWFGWKRKLNLLAIIVFLALLSFSLNVFRIDAHPVATFYSPQTRFWELMIGSTLGYLSIHRNSLNPEQRYGLPLALRSIVQRCFGHATARSRDFQSVAGATLIGLSLVVTDNSVAFPGWFAVLPTLGAALVLDAGAHAWINRKLLANRALVWLGLISFPLYLWHWPLLSFARILENGSISIPTAACAVVLAMLLAALTYRLVELPIRFGSTQRPITLVLLVLMLGLGLAGESVRKMRGFENRVASNPLIQEFTVYPHEPFHNTACDQRFPGFKSFSACLLSKDQAPTVLLLGDSHSNQYYTSLARELGNEAVINVAMWSCLPFAAEALTFHDECDEKSAPLWNFISANNSIHTVYLAGHWAYLSAGGFGKSAMGWRQAKPLTADQRASFIANGQRFIERLLQTGKTVVLLRDNPDLDFNIKACFDTRPLRFWGDLKEPCAMDKASYEMRAAPYERALDELLAKFPTLKTFDPKDSFCAAQSCRAANNGKSLYFDGDHLSPLGADAVIKRLLNN